MCVSFIVFRVRPPRRCCTNRDWPARCQPTRSSYEPYRVCPEYDDMRSVSVALSRDLSRPAMSLTRVRLLLTAEGRGACRYAFLAFRRAAPYCFIGALTAFRWAANIVRHFDVAFFRTGRTTDLPSDGTHGLLKCRNLPIECARCAPAALRTTLSATHAAPLKRSKRHARRSRPGRSLTRFGRWIVPPFNRVRALSGVVARIVTGPHDAHRQDPHRPMRYDTGRPRAVIRCRISQPRTASLPCPAGLRARRPSPMMDVSRKNAFSTRP